jgi:hypothetical protein
MESLDPANLADVKKGFNKPAEYAAVLDRLAQRNIYAVTSFIFGMDNDVPGVAERTLKEISGGLRGCRPLACLRRYPRRRSTNGWRLPGGLRERSIG